MCRTLSSVEQRAEVNDVAVELEDLRKTLDSRTAELDAEQETVLKLRRCGPQTLEACPADNTRP